MSKDTFYFSHDYNVRNDEKIKSLIRKYGMLGYGTFWSIVEDLYNNANALRLDCEGIAFDLRVDKSMVEFIINDSELFKIENGIISSDSVQRRIDQRKIKSKKASESANERWERIKNANALQTQSEGNAIKERKGKERKGNITVDSDLNFEKFWILYNKKQGKEKCLKIFSTLSVSIQQKIIEVVPSYVKSTPDIKFRKNPQTWLNGKHWEDELQESQSNLFSNGKETPKRKYNTLT